MVVCPVDPYVEADYFEALKRLSAQADKGEANLVLMGIEPTYPSEKYGYIIPKSSDETAMVATFKENRLRMWQKSISHREHCGTAASLLIS